MHYAILIILNSGSFIPTHKFACMALSLFNEGLNGSVAVDG